MEIKRLRSTEPLWRRKFRDALEKEADYILAVVGIMSAIYAWREWQLEGQREYVLIELQGMMARQQRKMDQLESELRTALDEGYATTRLG